MFPGQSLQGNIYNRIRHRQLAPSLHGGRRGLVDSRALAYRLQCDTELEGHSGCVNRLAWNETGSLLASGSDDTRVYLWKYPASLAGSPPSPFHFVTGHHANIFGVQFLPGSTDGHTIVTGAMDTQVRMHRLGEGGDVTTAVCKCHQDRVKEIAVTPHEPSLFLSAGEDGVIRQYDSRQFEGGGRTPSSHCPGCSVLVRRPACSFKSISINPIDPMLLLAGSDGPTVHVYDRRMLGGSPRHSSVLQFSPGHLARRGRARYGMGPTVTHVAWGRCGSAALANYSGDNVYLFDISAAAQVHTVSFRTPVREAWADTDAEQSHEVGSTSESAIPSGLLTVGVSSPIPTGGSVPLTRAAEASKQRGNDMYKVGRYHAAVEYYSEALARCSGQNHILLGNRAMALLKRGHTGDAYASLRDAELAVALEPGYHKGWYRRASALHKLRWSRQALLAALEYRKLFPANADDIKDLIHEIRASMPERGEAASASAGEDRGDDSDGSNSDDDFSYVPGPEDGGTSDGDDASSDTDGRAVGSATGDTAASSESRDWSAAHPRSPNPRTLDYSMRYVGHSNVQTDIKEASFFGAGDQFVVTGSDDGQLFMYDRWTGRLMWAQKGDNDIVNCVQSHPFDPVIASSGIDNSVKMWTPSAQENQWAGADLSEVVAHNQQASSRGLSGLRVSPAQLRALMARAGGEEAAQCAQQ